MGGGAIAPPPPPPGYATAIIQRFLSRAESKLVQKNSKKLPKLFDHCFTLNFLEQKHPEWHFN